MKRYFFVTTMGIAFNNTITINSFSIEGIEKYPTIKQCIDISNEKFPGLRNVSLIGISELSESDINQLFSEE